MADSKYPASSQSAGSEDATEPDRAVAHDHAGTPGFDTGTDSRMVTGSHHVREWQHRLEYVFVVGVAVGNPNERAVSVRCPNVLSLCPAVGTAPRVAVHTRGVKSSPTELTVSTADHEWCEDPVAGSNPAHVVADGLNDSHRLVTDPRACFSIAVAIIEPEIRPTDRCVRDSDKRVRWRLKLRFLDVFDANIAWSVEHGCAHIDRTVSRRIGVTECPSGRRGQWILSGRC